MTLAERKARLEEQRAQILKEREALQNDELKQLKADLMALAVQAQDMRSAKAADAQKQKAQLLLYEKVTDFFSLPFLFKEKKKRTIRKPPSTRQVSRLVRVTCNKLDLILRCGMLQLRTSLKRSNWRSKNARRWRRIWQSMEIWSLIWSEHRLESTRQKRLWQS